jgi:hypothetical protein
VALGNRLAELKKVFPYTATIKEQLYVMGQELDSLIETLGKQPDQTELAGDLNQIKTAVETSIAIFARTEGFKVDLSEANLNEILNQEVLQSLKKEIEPRNKDAYITFVLGKLEHHIVVDKYQLLNALTLLVTNAADAFG